MNNSLPLNVPRRPVLLVIMDGIGVNPCREFNAVAMAKTPCLDKIYANHATCLLEASGLPVGLPAGQMGNSEVGHLTLGAGRVLKQDLVKISDAIATGEFATNGILCAAIDRARRSGESLHLIALVSDGGVHSHINHLIATLALCKKMLISPILHMITDGRDTAPSCAEGYLRTIEKPLRDCGGVIGTIIGRFYALDRDKRWERVQQAWQAIVRGEGRRCSSPAEAMQLARDNGETDEFILPTVLDVYAQGLAKKRVTEFVFLNFRNDRPRELSESLAFENFTGFDRLDFTPVSLTTLTRYQTDYPFPYMFAKDVAQDTLGQVVSEADIKQLRSAETEKYPHVTFFFNGGKDEPLPLEHRELVPSPKVATYDLQPEMSAAGITNCVRSALDSCEFGLIVVNFANGDMVGHTGVPEAVISAVETVDACVGELWDVAVQKGYSIVLTADHGNADMLRDPLTGEVHTQHTTFPVACVVSDSKPRRLANAMDLTSIAPTVLELMGLKKPASMTGTSLLL